MYAGGSPGNKIDKDIVYHVLGTFSGKGLQEVTDKEVDLSVEHAQKNRIKIAIESGENPEEVKKITRKDFDKTVRLLRRQGYFKTLVKTKGKYIYAVR